MGLSHRGGILGKDYGHERGHRRPDPGRGKAAVQRRSRREDLARGGSRALPQRHSLRGDLLLRNRSFEWSDHELGSRRARGPERSKAILRAHLPGDRRHVRLRRDVPEMARAGEVALRGDRRATRTLPKIPRANRPTGAGLRDGRRVHGGQGTLGRHRADQRKRRSRLRGARAGALAPRRTAPGSGFEGVCAAFRSFSCRTRRRGRSRSSRPRQWLAGDRVHARRQAVPGGSGRSGTRLARRREPSRGGLDGDGRTAEDAEATDGPGCENGPVPLREGPLRPVANVAGRPHRVPEIPARTR
jgi:hypothetical protein